MQASKINRIKGIIFDLDGTLANTLHVSIASFKKSLEPLIGRVLSIKEIIETFGPTEEGTVRALAPKNYEKGISEYLINYKLLHNICPKPFDGIIELLEYLKQKQIKLAIVTGKGEESTMISLEYLDLISYFEIIETGSTYNSIKEQSIEKVIKVWKDFDNQSVIYVGDTIVDIEASNSAGIPIISVAWSDLANEKELKKANPENIFFSVRDFSKWVKSKV